MEKVTLDVYLNVGLFREPKYDRYTQGDISERIQHGYSSPIINNL